MGISLALISALFALLPGILCLAVFYGESGTAEVKITPPPLRSTTAVAFTGLFALISHLIWASVLWLNGQIADKIPGLFPIAPLDPYLILRADAPITDQELMMGLFGALAVCLVGMWMGDLIAKAETPADRRNEWLYGWLAPIVKRAAPENAFINGFALTTNQNGSDLLGYEGTVTNLILDQDKNIIGATLEGVETFYLRMNKTGTRRVKGGSEISTLVLRKDDFQNIALEVFQFEDETDEA